MGPVTIALLATLLPTCVLISGLVYLSGYLYFKLLLVRKENKRLRQQPPPATEKQLATEEQPATAVPAERAGKWPGEIPKVELPFELSPESKPDWARDVESITSNLSTWDLDGRRPVLTEPDAESWMARILDDLEYQGASPAVLLHLLRKGRTRPYAAYHIVNSVALARSSFESEPESTFLSFPPGVQGEIQKFFIAIKGIAFSPELATVLKTIPFKLLLHDRGNEEKMEEALDLLDQLFLPLADSHYLNLVVNPIRDRAFLPSTHGSTLRGFKQATILQQRMLASRQQFEFRWDETTKTSLCETPALYSHAGEDGAALAEPKLWLRSYTLDIAEDGTVTRRGGPDLSRLECY